MSVPIRIGTLGAARITPMALLRPALQVPDAVVVAVAARDLSRARAFADRHGIARVHASYESLLADPEIDAVYNPLPNSHHCEWSIKALEAGKHVLCEKPLASNVEEAERMGKAAGGSERVLMEAFHWRYHPLAARMREVLDSGEIGTVRHVEAHFCIPLVMRGDIRYRLDLAGGATMDVGCYAISIARYLGGSEPEVVSAHALLASPGVDRAMTADLRFADGKTGRISCSLLSANLVRARAYARGDEGELSVFNPIVPHFFHRLTVRRASGTRSERLRGDATYTYQLRAFVDAVRNGTPLPTAADHGIANMRVIDAVYRAAGLQPRGAAAA